MIICYIGEQTRAKSTVMINLNEIPRAKEFIMDLIQSVQGRIKG